MLLSLPRRFPVFSAFAFLWATPAFAENPIVQHIYTADPAPLVHDDTLYLYTSHDEDVTVDNFFTMNDWRVFSSKDAANWTDHGSPLSYQSFSWATGKAWAPHAIERNGKFYLYVPVSNSIGVAVADNPLGPFEDALGKPLLSNYQYIDPTVFIDDDGQAYLYFGNPKLWYVKLNEDMISYSGAVEQIPNTTASFGSRSGDASRPTQYEEGPWFYRRGDLYYMAFAAGPLPEKIGYATAPGATGPWTFRGLAMESSSGFAFTNHSGIVDFKGHSLFFYHTQGLPGGGGYKRSVALEEFTYVSDGSIPKVIPTKSGVAPLENSSSYERIEAETMAWSEGVEVDGTNARERYLSYLDNGDFVKVRGLDFGTGALAFRARVASAGPGGKIELHLDEKDGPMLASCVVSATGGWESWEEVSCDVDPDASAGVHDLFLVFSGSGNSLFNVDSWTFTAKDPIVPGSGGASGGDGSGFGGRNFGSGASAGSPGGGVNPATGGRRGSGDPENDARGAGSCACSHAGRSAPVLWTLPSAGVLLALSLRRCVRRRPGV